MLNYMEFLNLPGQIAFVLAALFFMSQLIGEFIELQGKAVPEIMKVRKYFARKKKESETMEQLPVMIDEFKTLVESFESHYSTDNIEMRNNWMSNVNHKLEEQDGINRELLKKIDKNNSDTLQILTDNKKDMIINFASYVTDKNKEVSREQFNRIFKVHKEYEDIIEENGLTNGEVDIAFRIITESYREHLQDRSFLEDLRKY